MRGLRPAPRLLWLTALLAVLALLGPLLAFAAPALSADADLLVEIVRLAALVLLIIALWDMLPRGRLQGIHIEREVAQNLPVNGWSEVVLRISHPFRETVSVDLFDDYPRGADIRDMPCTLDLQPQQGREVRYRLRPDHRGPAEFGATQIMLPSQLGLWRFSKHIGKSCAIRVYPDFAAIAHYELLATDNRTSQLGIKRRPRRGEGLEFHQLRDYREGDTMRQIDWKATVRRQKLISREYQDERDQQLFFMLDCGRRMRAQDDHLSHFDHALNALLLLSYVALRQGDAVGMMSFGGQQRWQRALKTSSAVNTLLNSVYDLHPSTQASDYLTAAETLISRQRKRSLVVLMTNLREESYEELMPAIRLLQRHHLVLLASIREQVLDKRLDEPVQDFEGALSYLGTSSYEQQRQKVIKQLRVQGVLALDVPAGDLAVRTVNSYLDIKRNRYL